MSIEIETTISAECPRCGGVYQIGSNYDDIDYIDFEREDLARALERHGQIITHGRDEYWICESCRDEVVEDLDVERMDLEADIKMLKEKLEELEKKLEDWWHYKQPKRNRMLLRAVGIQVPEPEDSSEEEKESA